MMYMTKNQNATLPDTPGRPRVLLIAEACNPEWQSVPLEGYNLYRAINQIADVTLATQIRNRDALLRHVDPQDKITFINSELLSAPFYHLGRLLTLGRGLGWTTKQAVMMPPYLYYEYLVYRQFRRQLQAGQFDLIHRITPLSPTYPSPLPSWTDVPFVVGPLNGGLPWPKGTNKIRLAEMEWMSYLRNAYRLLPYHRSTYSKAAAIIAGSRHTEGEIPAEARNKTHYIAENGINPDRFRAGDRTPPGNIAPFRVLFLGRLVPYKGADIVVEAFAAARLPDNAQLTIIGDGPQRPALEDLAKRSGIQSRVTFTGQIPQTETVSHLQSSSVFAFPSMREFGGAVVIEAMACGLPSIVLDYGGPGEHVTPETGIALPMADRAEIKNSFIRSLEHLANNPAKLNALSQAGLQRIEKLYTWPAKARLIRRVYDRVLATISIS